METISNTNFDQLEKLLRTKKFDELTTSEKQWAKTFLSEDEYTSMSVLYISIDNSKLEIELEPQLNRKIELNKIFATQSKRSGLLQLKVPVYQSVAAAMIFFLIGFGMNFSIPLKPKVIHDTVQVIKYIKTKEKPKIMYVESSKQTKKTVKPIEKQTVPEPIITTQSEEVISTSETNPEILRQQEITMTNINHILNEKNGTSMIGDTVLQKMLVTLN